LFAVSLDAGVPIAMVGWVALKFATKGESSEVRRIFLPLLGFVMFPLLADIMSMLFSVWEDL
jgi:hypothetical protein